MIVHNADATHQVATQLVIQTRMIIFIIQYLNKFVWIQKRGEYFKLLRQIPKFVKGVILRNRLHISNTSYTKLGTWFPLCQ